MALSDLQGEDRSEEIRRILRETRKPHRLEPICSGGLLPLPVHPSRVDALERRIEALEAQIREMRATDHDAAEGR